jgi:hypothetical protein
MKCEALRPAREDLVSSPFAPNMLIDFFGDRVGCVEELVMQLDYQS